MRIITIALLLAGCGNDIITPSYDMAADSPPGDPESEIRVANGIEVVTCKHGYCVQPRGDAFCASACN